MTTIADKLTAIAEAKGAIKVAIEAKGVEVADAPLSQYPAKIESIQAAGGGKFILPSKFLFSSSTNQRLDFSADVVDASNVTYMQNAFSSCNFLEEINVGGLVTSQVTNINGFFNRCSMLKKIDISSWDTSGVTDMSYLCYYCERATEINADNLDVSKCNSILDLFGYCYELTHISVKNWKFPETAKLYRIFDHCVKLELIDLSDWNISVSKMDSIFAACRACKEIKFGEWDTSAVTNMASSFSECFALETLDLSGWDLSNVTNVNNMFYKCGNLVNLKVNICITMKLDECPLSHESLMYIINNAKDLTGGTAQTLTLGSTNLAKLTDDEKAIIIAKNWTLA